ncbi:hypothetical protein HYALB_00001983 [Hymenoscyphus albidus]|uniref:Uncharacterized protein n=1 Tax=Hymenoscyphus albidus TaxID=595503 RepID=A0A9N9LAZ1_9HELO|nr:hypothetical protein HYALB_00001983 [Hymenoscyphus albidus]
MNSLLGEHFKLQEVSKHDLAIASIVIGFTFGIGTLATWKAFKQTSRIYLRYGAAKLNTPYIWMIWLEIIVCCAMAIISYLHLYGVIPHSFLFYFGNLVLWSIQVQLLLQIIINRICLLLPDRKKGLYIKIGPAIIITAINISVFCIWIPARLQISARMEYINNIWDRCEKIIYLGVDGSLNLYFIRSVQRKLVKNGFVKYDRLVRFNKCLVGLSLSMDVLIIATMSLKNGFVYNQFHPLAYIVKLKIEMSMADLIVRVCNTTNDRAIPKNIQFHLPFQRSQSRGGATSERSSTALERFDILNPKEIAKPADTYKSITEIREGQLAVKMKREVHMIVEDRISHGDQKSLKSCRSGRAF